MKRLVFWGVLTAMLMLSPFSGSMVQGAEDEDIQRLIDALWRDPISDLDITMYKEVRLRPKSREETAQMVNRMYDAMCDSADDISRDEQMALVMKSRKNVHVFKEHTVAKGDNQLVERVTIGPERARGTGRDEVFGNVAASGEYSYRIDHINKYVSAGGSGWKEAHYDNLGTFSEMSSALLRSRLGDYVKGEDGLPLRDGSGARMIVPNVDKAASMLSGTADSPIVLSLSEGDVVSGRQTVVLEMSFNDEAGAQKLVRKWQLDAGNFAMCYREEVFNLDGSPMVVRTADAFEEVGSSGVFFPRKASIIEYEKGAIKTSIAYVIAEVRFNTGVSDSFFELKAPADYTIVDNRKGAPLIATPPIHDEIMKVAAETADSTLDAPPDDDETVVEEPESNNDDTPEIVPETVAEESEAGRSRVAVLIAVSCGVALLAVVLVVARALRKNRR